MEDIEIENEEISFGKKLYETIQNDSESFKKAFARDKRMSRFATSMTSIFLGVFSALLVTGIMGKNYTAIVNYGIMVAVLIVLSIVRKEVSFWMETCLKYHELAMSSIAIAFDLRQDLVLLSKISIGKNAPDSDVKSPKKNKDHAE